MGHVCDMLYRKALVSTEYKSFPQRMTILSSYLDQYLKQKHQK